MNKKNKQTLIQKITYYIFWRPIVKIETFFNSLRNRCQRFMHGYSMYDVSEIDTWFLTNIIPMLKKFKKDIVWGVPPDISENQFEKIIDEMIEGFEEVERYHFEYGIFDDELNSLPAEEKIFFGNLEVVSRKKYDKAFKLFHKYFHYLSD